MLHLQSQCEERPKLHFPLFIQPFQPFCWVINETPPTGGPAREEPAAGGRGWMTGGTEEGGWEEKDDVD